MKKYQVLLLMLTIIFFIENASGQISPTSISTGKLVSISPELRNIRPESAVRQAKNRSFAEDENVNKRVKFPVNNLNARSVDEALQSRVPFPNSPTSPSSMGITFDGNTQVDNAALGFPAYTPPDPSMSVGPNHVVQMINVAHSVYNKAGTRLSGPTKFSSIASFAGDDGDPIALYDQQADRWVLLQFNLPAGNESLVFCISKTNDPAGAYYVYNFPTPGVFPDYPHVGVWNNSYVITTHEFNLAGTSYLGQGYYAVDRKKMVTGSATSTLIRFQVATDGGYLPASFEGFKTPDPTSLPTFCGWDATELGAASDRLLIRTMNPNFVTPASSTLSSATVIATAAFDGRSPSSRSAIEQSGTANGLDAIADRMMSRVIYRRFDNYESLVMNHAVNASLSDGTTSAKYTAGMRWYELRRATPASAWTINQQSTYAPTFVPSDTAGATGLNRWMGSIGIDQKGSIAIAYSRSSSTTFPGLYYAERKVTDPVSVLGAEQTFFAGTGSQTSSGNRWGDYTSMNIDPSNEDSIWFTDEYYSATASTNFKTRIGKFSIDLPPSSPTIHFKTSGTIVRQNEATTLVGGSTCIRYKDYPINIVIDQAPSADVTVTLTSSGTATLGTDYDLIYTSPIILNGANLSRQITLRVYDEGPGEADEFLDLAYTFSGGNGAAGLYNQKHRITIYGTPATDINSFLQTNYTSSTLFSDNFDAVSSGLGAWTEQIVTLVGTTNLNHFIVGTNFSTGFTGKALYISDDNSLIHYTAISPNSDPNKVILRAISPSINTVGKNLVTVSFKYKAVGETPTYDFGSLYYSIDGGTNWVDADAAQKLQSQATVIVKTITLPANAANIANLKIAFQWENDYSVDNQPPLGVDSVVVNGLVSTVNAQIQSAVNTSTVGTFNFGPNQTIQFADTAAKKIMVTLVNNSSWNFGCTKVEIDRAGTGAVAFNASTPGEYCASKTFKITPQFNNTSASYTITVYYTEAEIAGWEAATGQSRTGIKLVKVNGNNAISDVNPVNQATFVYSVNTPVTAAFGSDGLSYQYTFASSGFSGFTVGKPQAVPVPVTLIDFRGEHLKTQGNKLYWEVTNQINVKHYELQFSTDGVNFAAVGTVDARTYTGGNLSYSYLHRDYVKGNNFYRLKTVDLNGRTQLSGIVLITVTEKGSSIIVYPNPVKDKLVIDYSGESKSIGVEIIDAAGRLVYNSKTTVTKPVYVSVAKLAAGEYILRITDAETVLTEKFIKE